MTANIAKRRMLEGKPGIGVIVALGSPVAGEILSRAGFDFVLVDNQHGAWDDASSTVAFRGIHLGSAVPMARVRKNDFYDIGQLLDRGALGIVVPMIESAEEAEAAAHAVRYPPRGGRSWWPLQAGFYGSDYGEWIDDEVFLAVQIESEQAVNRAEEILAVDGVDGCWVGPTDLGRSMGIDPSTPEGAQALETAILHVLEVCRAANKIPGIAALNDAHYWIERGFLFVTAGSDVDFVTDGAREALHALQRLS